MTTARFHSGASQSDFKNAILDSRIWLLFAALQLPTLRPLFKYLPERMHFIIPLYLAGTFTVYAIILHSGRFRRISGRLLGSGWTLAALCLILATANFLVYPIADGLAEQMRGSDQDDALIQSGVRLVAGLNPYETSTYRGNPISPGPGWIALVLPFSLTGTYFLLTPLSVLGAAVLLRKLRGDFYWANLMVILLMSSAAFWEVMVVGSDMPALGFLFLACVVLVYHKWDRCAAWSIFCAVLTGLSATGRIIFAYLVPLIGVFLWKRNWRTALRFTLSSGLLCFGVHFLFYIWNPSAYTPLHLLSKGGTLLISSLRLPALLCSAAAIVLTGMKSRDKLDVWTLLSYLCLLVPLAFVSLGGLIRRSFNFADWEEANYLMLVVPIYVFYVAMTAIQNQDNHKSVDVA